MTLLDKIINQSKIQDQLNAQLAEISYRAMNGTRQAPRNFAEGTLNVGTMNFKTPDGQITKEMIMDYQQKEQEKYYYDPISKNKFVNVPTELTDSLTPYTPIPYGPIGAEATDTDLEKEQNVSELLQNDLNTIKNTGKTKVQELKKNQTELRQAREFLDRLHQDIKDLEIKLQKAQDLATGLTPEQLLKSPGADKKLNKIIKDTETMIIDFQSQVPAAELEVLNAANRILTVQKEITTIRTDVSKKEQEIMNQDLVIEQVKDNIEENKVGRQNNVIENKKVAKKYEETFNYVNRNRNSVQQQPGEDDQDFIDRIASMEKLPFDPNIFKGKAEIEGNRTFMQNLKQITRDETKISDIAKSFPKPEDVFTINNNWDTILNQLKIKFGVNNPNISVIQYSTEIKDVIDSLTNTPFGTTVIPPSTVMSGTYAVALPLVPTTVLRHGDGSVSDFETALERNSLYIKNTRENKGIYIKIATKGGQKFILFSNSKNDEGNFRPFNFGNIDSNLTFKTVMKALKLDESLNKGIFVYFFGTGTTWKDKYDFLEDPAGKFKLKSVGTKPFIEAGKSIQGWGMKSEEVPKATMFGKNIILLNKLYYKNILAIKDKKGHAVEHFPNIKVSDTLAEIILNMCSNIQPTKQDLDSLKKNERELFDLLLYVSGLSKKFNTKKDDNINELKDRLKLVEAEIRAGNDNPITKNELKGIVHKLQLYNCISMNNAKNYLKQF